MKEDNHKADSADEDSWAQYADASYGKSEILTEESNANPEKKKKFGMMVMILSLRCNNKLGCASMPSSSRN